MEHQNGAVEGFTKKYNCHKLVYYEVYDIMIDAKNRVHIPEHTRSEIRSRSQRLREAK